MKVIKRTSQEADFEREKIKVAIEKAMKETEKGIDSKLSEEISLKIEDLAREKDKLDIETIQDMVEMELMKTRGDVAKKYILYREERQRLREEGWPMSDLQKDIYESKYRYKNESFSEFLHRIGGGNSKIEKAIRDQKFIPAGRILAGRGLHKDGRKVTLSNCYVMPKVEDSIEDIYDTAKRLARTYSYGGGVGINISKLRPRGAKVNNAARTTTGAVSFMDLFSQTTSLIGMKGRRGALMINMDVSHPDIEEFIDIKSDLDKITSANISINVTNDFMEAVKNDEDYELKFTVEASGEEIKKTVRAKDLFYKLAKNNWDMAEPGILYWDRINSWHLMSEDPDFSYAGVNPCAEEPLPAFGSCNLGSINLGNFVSRPFTDQADFDFEAFGTMVEDGVIYLNEILDENMELHPLKEQREESRALRQIGLGIMGLADSFIKLGIRYGSKESLELIDRIGHVLINRALKQSALLAKEDGPFPRYKEEAILASAFLKANVDEETIYLIKKYGLRNSQVLTIAPTGSISTLIGASNGVEPLFQISYTRKTESLQGEDRYYKVYSEIIKELMDAKEIDEDEDLPDYVITSDKLNYRERIEIQSAFQKYIDASISSTINLANETSVEEVEDLYFYGWEKGLKGLTIYRDGCKRSGILISDQANKSKIARLQEELNREIAKELDENPEICPMCQGHMVHSGGCMECQDCGYSPCAI